MDSFAELFLKYDYAETKDLCRQFLTLVVAVLVFSVTFSEKIVDFPRAPAHARVALLSAWGSFVLAIVGCGLGLVLITLAAGQAVYGQNFVRLATYAWLCGVSAGILFVGGLCGLVSAAVVSAYGARRALAEKANSAQSQQAR